MKRAALIALIAIAAKVAYEFLRRQRSPGTLPDGARYEPAPVPETSPSTPDLSKTHEPSGAPATTSSVEAPAAAETTRVPAVTDRPAPVAESMPSPHDDLTQVRGIGPVYAGRLRDLGIATFAALESTDTEVLAGNLDVPPAMVANWQNQARGLRS